MTLASLPSSAANAEGSGYATAKFVVQNANGEDSAPNTLTFNVTAVEVGLQEVLPLQQMRLLMRLRGAAVTANASGLTDVDGSFKHDISVVYCG